MNSLDKSAMGNSFHSSSAQLNASGTTADTNWGECAICLVPFGANERHVAKTDCNHRYHDICLSFWLAELPSENMTCPMCREKVVDANVPTEGPAYLGDTVRKVLLKIRTLLNQQLAFQAQQGEANRSPFGCYLSPENAKALGAALDEAMVSVPCDPDVKSRSAPFREVKRCLELAYATNMRDNPDSQPNPDPQPNPDSQGISDFGVVASIMNKCSIL